MSIEAIREVAPAAIDSLLQLAAAIGQPCDLVIECGDWPALHVAGFQVCSADGSDFDVWADTNTPTKFGLTIGETVAYISGSVR